MAMNYILTNEIKFTITGEIERIAYMRIHKEARHVNAYVLQDGGF